MREAHFERLKESKMNHEMLKPYAVIEELDKKCRIMRDRRKVPDYAYLILSLIFAAGFILGYITKTLLG